MTTNDAPFLKACRREPTRFTPVWLMLCGNLLGADGDQPDPDAAPAEPGEGLARTGPQAERAAPERVTGRDVLVDVLVGNAERTVRVGERAGLRCAVPVAPATLELLRVEPGQPGEPQLQQLRLTRRKLDERVPQVEDDGADHGRFFRIRSTCFQVCVLTTSVFASHALLAWPTPSST